MAQTVYKICTLDEWSNAKRIGRFAGSQVDIDDGYIHLSTEAQVRETAAKYFADGRNLVLVGFWESDLKDRLRWEPSRGGAMFPHYYGSLDPSLARNVWPLELASDGSHAFPDIIP